MLPLPVSVELGVEATGDNTGKILAEVKMDDADFDRVRDYIIKEIARLAQIPEKLLRGDIDVDWNKFKEVNGLE